MDGKFEGRGPGYFTSIALNYWFQIKYCPSVLSPNYPGEGPRLTVGVKGRNNSSRGVGMKLHLVHMATNKATSGAQTSCIFQKTTHSSSHHGIATVTNASFQAAPAEQHLGIDVCV
jgi:hypothetical protein